MSINSFDNYPMSWKPDLSRTSGPKYLALVSLMEERNTESRNKAAAPERIGGLPECKPKHHIQGL